MKLEMSYVQVSRRFLFIFAHLILLYGICWSSIGSLYQFFIRVWVVNLPSIGINTTIDDVFLDFLIGFLYLSEQHMPLGLESFQLLREIIAIVSQSIVLVHDW